MATTDFIENIAPLVQKYAPQYGIKVCSPIIAQAILESGSGTSNKVFTKDGNGDIIWRHNYFGLKWRNNRCAVSNDYFEEITSEQNADGSYRQIVDRFFKFKSMEDGVLGYFQWTNTANYANLKGVTDPYTYLKNIKEDKYATSLKYVDNVMSVVNKYDLTRFDTVEKEVVKMSNSPLVSYTKISPSKTSPRNHAIDTITIHCMAGNLSVESCGNVFQNREASSNYGIGSDGRVGMYVEEGDRSWCSSNKDNDHRAVTIEVANDGGADTGWHVSDKAMATLIALCADICKRNNIKQLKWKGDKSLVGNINEQNMTVHRWFAAKACPGDYLYSKHSYIAEEVNKLLGNPNSTISVPTETTSTTSVPFYITCLDDLNIRVSPGGDIKIAGGCRKGIKYTIVETSGDWGKLKSGAGWVTIKPKYVTISKI